MPLIKALAFEEIQGLDVQAVIDSVNFPTRREPLIARDTLTRSPKDAIFRDGQEAPLGIISQNRPNQSYTDQVSWLLRQIEDTGVPFKIQTSVINEKTSDLYQEIVFDHSIRTPDGTNMNPMFIARHSLIGAPLNLIAGTYRYTCANGALVGKTLGKIKLGIKDITAFMALIVSGQINNLLGRYAEIENLYANLGETKIADIYKPIFSNEKFPAKAKREILHKLEHDGVLTITHVESEKEPEDGSLIPHLKKVDFETIDLSTQIHDLEASGWDVYNLFTNWATHTERSEQSRMSAYRNIDELFTSVLQS